MTTLVFVLLLCGLICDNVSGSSIKMFSSPDTITPLLTPEMSVTCLLNSSTTTPATGLVGRRRRDVAEDFQTRSITDVVTTKENVAYISSIALMKSSGEKIAMLIEHTSPKLLSPGATNAVVTGNVTGAGTDDVRGYLQVTWEFPTQQDTGDFVCEITTVAKDGTGVGFKTSLHIPATTTTPSVTDLSVPQIGHISDIMKENRQQKNEISTLQNKITNLGCGCGEKAGHVENGTLVYFNPEGWPSSNTYTYTKDPHLTSLTMRYKDIHVAFTKVYVVPPAVTWSVGSLYDHLNNLLYAVELREVSTTGFTLRVGVHAINRNYMFNHLVLEWLSIPR